MSGERFLLVSSRELLTKGSLITTFCVKDLVPTRQPPTIKRRAEPLPKRGPGRPGKRPCLQVAPEPAVHHDLSDAVYIKMLDEYHHRTREVFFSCLPRVGADGRTKTANNFALGALHMRTHTRTRSTLRL